MCLGSFVEFVDEPAQRFMKAITRNRTCTMDGPYSPFQIVKSKFLGKLPNTHDYEILFVCYDKQDRVLQSFLAKYILELLPRKFNLLFIGRVDDKDQTPGLLINVLPQ
eukprot:TRINITY_DN12690_c0_g1_i2.p3 TRINITY_DN12690_c0_g1~~TRINITY_DN12690_c0_g1_i2.p3  ORF type:complete len:108 (+),score=4.14 TRINITY_DN12690_c0_g1_i2:301-624(+)